jgi:alkylated DNA repair dioxygenase AlkB
MDFNQIDLFASYEPKKTEFNLPNAEIILIDHLFSPEESNRLYKNLTENIKWQQDQMKIFGKSVDLPRLTAYYGDSDLSYSYSGIDMKPHPWNYDLLFIKARIEKEVNTEFTSCLLNFYRHGKDSMGWHQDNEKELGENPTIASVTFGETRPFQLKHISDKQLKKVDIPLTHGSLLIMQGTTQHFWKHQIPKTNKPIQPRINLTFRIIK